MSRGLTLVEQFELAELRRVDGISRLFTAATRKAITQPDLMRALGEMEERAVLQAWTPRHVELALSLPVSLWSLPVETICELALARRDTAKTAPTVKRKPRTIAGRFLV